jgi:hypothetical protein
VPGHRLEPETAPEPETATPDEGKGPGKVRGTILAAEDGEEVDDAHIYVAGSAVEALSDRDGKFTLELPAGVYLVSVVHADFATHTIPNFRVRPGKIATLNVPLQPPGGFDEWVVSAPRIQGGVATVLQERRKAATMTDAVGAEDIRRSPDSTASTATRRVVGASVVGGQFLFVRGLGGRYTDVRLNGVPLP